MGFFLFFQLAHSNTQAIRFILNYRIIDVIASLQILISVQQIYSR